MKIYTVMLARRWCVCVDAVDENDASEKALQADEEFDWNRHVETTVEGVEEYEEKQDG